MIWSLIAKIPDGILGLLIGAALFSLVYLLAVWTLDLVDWATQ